MNRHNLFQLHNVNLKIKGTFILKNIQLDVGINEYVFLLGNNGSGKSSLIEILLDNIKAEGEVHRQLPAKRQIGLLFDQVPFSPLYRVKEVIKLYALLFHFEEDSYQSILEQLALGPILNKKIGMLSTGERKRIGLFTALFHNPTLLVLDEPLSGIDPNSMQQINTLIFTPQRTVVIASHDWDSAQKYAHKIAFLHQGDLLGGIARSPQDWLSESIIPFVDKIVVKADSIEDIEQLKSFSSLFLTYDNQYILFGFDNRLLDWLQQAKIAYSRVPKSLYDIYHHLIAKK